MNTPDPAGGAAEAARRMQHWEPSLATWACRCSGPCLHGETCPDCRSGRLIHTARTPDSLFDPTQWREWHRCNDRCDTGQWFYLAHHPDRPWGYKLPTGQVVVFPGVDYPGYARKLADYQRQERELAAGTYVWGEEFDPDGYTL